MDAILMINIIDISLTVVVGKTESKTETHLSRYSNLHYKCIIIINYIVCVICSVC